MFIFISNQGICHTNTLKLILGQQYHNVKKMRHLGFLFLKNVPLRKISEQLNPK
jgi:hypothetical protein